MNIQRGTLDDVRSLSPFAPYLSLVKDGGRSLGVCLKAMWIPRSGRVT
jgi:hypothetical protein